jgi:hypothetical protein
MVHPPHTKQYALIHTRGIHNLFSLLAPTPSGLGYFSIQTFHIHTAVTSYPLAYEDGTVCSETLVFTLQTPGNHPEKAHDVNLDSFKILD